MRLVGGGSLQNRTGEQAGEPWEPKAPGEKRGGLLGGVGTATAQHPRPQEGRS